MNITEHTHDEYILPKEPSKNMRFIKNEEGQREAKELSDSEIEETRTKKLGIIVVGIHTRHTQMQILQALNQHKETIQGDVIMIGYDNYHGPLVTQEQLKELAQIPIIITAREHDLVEIFVAQSQQPYKTFAPHHTIPKPQKSKGYTPKGQRTTKK